MSLALATIGSKNKQQPAKASRLSHSPVNQFDTPHRTKLVGTPLSASSNASTPRETLFSDDAEYASVFKTRTKIALSPMLSPERSLLDDIRLREEMDGLDVDD
ncbi:MAG: hypothetical protein M1823_008599, partial [Watsoniomyces obsoletus]